MSVRLNPIYPANLTIFEEIWIFGRPKRPFWTPAAPKRDMMWYEILQPIISSLIRHIPAFLVMLWMFKKVGSLLSHQQLWFIASILRIRAVSSSTGFVIETCSSSLNFSFLPKIFCECVEWQCWACSVSATSLTSHLLIWSGSSIYLFQTLIKSKWDHAFQFW